MPLRRAGNVPTIDIRNTCKIAAGAMVRLMGSTSMERDIEICLGSEQSARDQLVKDWGTYSSRDRERCVRPGVYLPSYVEWLTCLEMERDARKMNIDQTNPGLQSPSRSCVPAAFGERPPAHWNETAHDGFALGNAGDGVRWLAIFHSMCSTLWWLSG